MRKEELEDKLLNEYVEVDSYEPCSVPLKQATKILGIKRGDLPTIRMPVVNLIDCFKWLEKEKTKGQLIYNTHIENTKQCLIEQYPEIKVKLHEDFKPKHSGYNPTHKSEEVRQFVDNAIILELNHTMIRLGSKSAFEERTLH